MATSYATYPQTPAFIESPDSIRTIFAVTIPFIKNTLVVSMNGLIWKGISTPTTTSVVFDEPPPIGSELFIVSGFIGEAIPTSDYIAYLAELDTLLQDQNPTPYLTQGQRIQFLMQAVAEYSKHRPRHLTVDRSGSDSYYMELPPEWDQALSEIKQLLITLPDDQFDVVSPTLYSLLQTPTGWSIYGRGRWLPSDTFRLDYTVPHIFTPAQTTIPAADRAAIVAYAASQACLAISAAFIHTYDSTYGGGEFQRPKQTENYQKLAALYEQTWRTTMDFPVKSDNYAAGFTTVTWHYHNHQRILH